MNPKISIITVCFNAEKTIEETIRSVISQTYKNIEYVIIDGKSSDNTLKIVQNYSHNINKLVSEKDTGLYDAMNKGVKNAKGEVVYFLNADDILVDKHVISEVVKEFNKDSLLDMVYGDVSFYYSFEKKTIKISRIASLSELKNGYMFPHQGAFVKKKWLEKYPFSLEYRSSSDFDFFCNFLKEKPKIKKISIIIARMTMGGVSSSSISYKETQAVIKKHFGIVAYFLVILKHFSYLTLKKLFKFLKIDFHKG